MTKRIRIGNQTAFSAAEPMAPFDFALAQGFDTFEWFADKKQDDDGSWSGWDFADMASEERARIKRMGEEKDILYTVHAPWQANPLRSEGEALLLQSVDFARDIGADLVNLHLYTEEGSQVFLNRLAPVIAYAAERGVRISLENTPITTPADFRDFFACLSQSELPGKAVGMCLDIGHANLCDRTRNDFIRYLDELGTEVPIIHMHLHENYGDFDRHLPLFTGPAGENDGGIRLLIERLKDRHYEGALILEVWPQPPELLSQARHRLRPMLNGSAHKGHHRGKDRDDKKKEKKSRGKAGASARSEKNAKTARPRLREVDALRASSPPEMGTLPDYSELEDAFTRTVVQANSEHKSWRERLGWVHETLTGTDFDPTPERLATLAVYLRFLGTGEVQCEEDGRHFRPNHHAGTAADIEAILENSTGPENAWILRKIYPWLPSFADDFRRREPLTRIRDIAHRNDIPRDLKNEIKHRLQNKLHRCAGPEDFLTSEEILERITAPGTSYSPDFVHQFEIFHEELGEFFNASALDVRLEDIAASLGTDGAAQVKGFLALKAKPDRSEGELLALLGGLTALRTAIGGKLAAAEGARAQHLRMTDIALEDYAFALLSEVANRLEKPVADGLWDGLFRALSLALANLQLSRIEPEECTVLVSELSAWSKDLANGPQGSDRLALLRLKATLERAERLAEGYTDRVLTLFPGRVTSLGRSLGVQAHAIAVFCEGDIRGNVVFQLSKLVELIGKGVRSALGLPPWEAVVPGQAHGLVVKTDNLLALEGRTAEQEPLIALVEKAEGDEEIPTGVRGILLGHTIPHLSHLGVRARQAGIAFAAADDRQRLGAMEALTDKYAHLRVGPDDLSLEESDRRTDIADESKRPGAVRVPDATLTSSMKPIPASEARNENCGAKATGAGRLLELAQRSEGMFHAPCAFALPFGVMERCMEDTPDLSSEYRAMESRLNAEASQSMAGWMDGAMDSLLEGLRESIGRIRIPDEIVNDIRAAFPDGARLAIRSSANGEDLEHLSGAGLYDSVVGVRPAESAEAIRQVWASIWTRRATTSRIQAGIPHGKIRMAVLVQELVEPDLSFVMHTVDPTTKDRETAYAELAIGLGETLASASQPGTPYRLRCNRTTGEATLANCASFSYALRPAPGGKLAKERLDYSADPIAAQTAAAEDLGRRLAAIASFLEERLGYPQDVEGVLSNDKIYIVQARPQQGI